MLKLQANWNGFLAAPVASDNSYDVETDTSVSGNVITDDTGNGVDTDADGDQIFADPRTVTPPANGNLTLDADGSFTYTPNAGFTGR